MQEVDTTHNYKGRVEDGLLDACRKGCVEDAKLMIEKGATNFDDCLLGACYNDRVETAK